MSSVICIFLLVIVLVTPMLPTAIINDFSLRKVTRTVHCCTIVYCSCGCIIMSICFKCSRVACWFSKSFSQSFSQSGVVLIRELIRGFYGHGRLKNTLVLNSQVLRCCQKLDNVIISFIRVIFFPKTSSCC